MKKYVNGEYIELTQEDLDQMWDEEVLSYDDAVNQKIRQRYTESQEFAILRQRDEKPDEFAEYYAYCEECKARAKEIIQAQQ